MKSYLPLAIKGSPIKKLALLPIEKDLDEVYRGFELQYIDDGISNKGYRMLGYRNDNYVDVYDDMSLVFDPKEDFAVVENGCNQHVQANLEHTVFQNCDGREQIACTFTDILGRKIEIDVQEHSNGKTKPMNLLAPIGLGSANPTSLPVFFMYDFDFIRKRKAKIVYTIDGRQHQVDEFPMPMNLQKRYYARFSEECTLLEFAPATETQLTEIELDQHKQYQQENITYVFEAENVLNRIEVQAKPSNVTVTFSPAFNLQEQGNGTFRIEDDGKMGNLSGTYTIKREGDTAVTELKVSGGWQGRANSLITKIMFGKNMVFSTWSKGYTLTQQINLVTGEVSQKWVNENGGK